MAGVEVATHAWKEWGLQALVLLSFTLQVALLILAEFRRCIDHGVLRVLVSSAYMLADGTAIYVLGHLSATSRSPEHELMAFWAPFLLLHRGGQDNITAYAIEDNRLWLRHLQTLAVQMAAAGYVLYGSSIVCSHSLLLWAAILMFLVGVVNWGPIRGRAVLKSCRLYEGLGLEESILAWHITTEVYLYWYGERAKAAGYMLFLLAARPFMLSPTASRNAYVNMCYSLTSLRLELIALVWVEMLCYAGRRCSAYSHAKQLSNGGELITIAAILVEYIMVV
ncbi:hypothetical protein E2562_023330 [Oryza meyeriana var. granulata]|uniref:DUF4220 domain-containing protein n=1 Tax=Oryza meyeriana var. granulata TaxID=110450 RepID=A0A6G1E0M5_9ORYZ|nr:hypothetical protein E2562_023330 [Oryza meyeriana var. granulata]